MGLRSKFITVLAFAALLVPACGRDTGNGVPSALLLPEPDLTRLLFVVLPAGTQSPDVVLGVCAEPPARPESCQEIERRAPLAETEVGLKRRADLEFERKTASIQKDIDAEARRLASTDPILNDLQYHFQRRDYDYQQFLKTVEGSELLVEFLSKRYQSLAAPLESYDEEIAKVAERIQSHPGDEELLRLQRTLASERAGMVFRQENLKDALALQRGALEHKRTALSELSSLRDAARKAVDHHLATREITSRRLSELRKELESLADDRETVAVVTRNLLLRIQDQGIVFRDISIREREILDVLISLLNPV